MQCSVQIFCCCGDPAESNVQCKFVVVVATLHKAMFSTKFVVVVVATLQNAMFSAYLLLLWQPCRKQCSVQICCCCGDPAESNVQCKYVVVVATLLNAVSSTPKFVVYQWL